MFVKVKITAEDALDYYSVVFGGSLLLGFLEVFDMDLL